MLQKWRFIQSRSYPSALNMAIDEAIMLAVSEGKSLPTIRFYRWQPATISIGYFQKAEDELDVEAIRSKGIGLVRRPTGGRAVLHDQELTYSMILPESYPGLASSVTESYRMLSMGLLRGFQLLGLDAIMADLNQVGSQGNEQIMSSAACFDSPSWYEIVVDGQKIAGSAQLRQKGVVLQHGSVLVDIDVDTFYSVLKFKSEEQRVRMKSLFAKKAVAINDLLLTRQLERTTITQVEAVFEQGFAEGLKIALIPGELSEQEWATANQLVETKYGQESYLFKK